MKPVIIFKNLVLIGTAIYSFNALGYADDKKKEACRQPKVQEFTLPIYQEPDRKEAPAEAEFSFVVSGWAEPKKFKLSAKNIDIPFTVQSTETFHKVKAKLPASLTGESVRINARIPAVLGCYTTIGWLIKVADKPKAEAPKSAETVSPQNAVPGASQGTTGVQNAETMPKPSAVPIPENTAPVPSAPTPPPAPANNDVAP
jgi:hypothetical protein